MGTNVCVFLSVCLSPLLTQNRPTAKPRGWYSHNTAEAGSRSVGGAEDSGGRSFSHAKLERDDCGLSGFDEGEEDEGRDEDLCEPGQVRREGVSTPSAVFLSFWKIVFYVRSGLSGRDGELGGDGFLTRSVERP